MESKEELGEWVGLCKIDKDGKPRKVVKCSCVVVKVRCSVYVLCMEIRGSGVLYLGSGSGQ